MWGLGYIMVLSNLIGGQIIVWGSGWSLHLTLFGAAALAWGSIHFNTLFGNLIIDSEKPFLSIICLKLVNYFLFDLHVGLTRFLSEPWFAPYLIKCDSIFTVWGEELEDKLFKSWWELISFVNSAPISIQLIVKDKLVKLVVFGCLNKWVDSSDYDEEYYSDAEDINLFTIVDLAIFDLWSHVGLGTSELL